MAKKITTLYVAPDSLRLMLTEGNRIKAWAEAPLEPGTVENAVIVKPDEFGETVRKLLESQQITSKKVMVGISGLRCLTRPIILPELPENILGEAVRREAERALPVPLDQLHLSWQTVSGPEGKSQVFVVGVPREAADSLLKALGSAGLKPTFMAAKPVLLSSLIQDTLAVIVDVQPKEFDIVVMADGIPQPVRTILLPSETDDWEEKLDVIASETTRTVTFYNANNPDNPLDSGTPVYISGDIATEPELCESLSEKIGFALIPLESSLHYPESFIPENYMANIGLVLHELSGGKKKRKSTSDLNILPAAYLPKPISLVNVVTIPAFVVLLGIVAAMFVLNQNISADITGARGQIAAEMLVLQQKQVERQTLDTIVTVLGENITDARDSLNRFTEGYAGLQRQRNAIDQDLQTTIFGIPTGVTMTSIAHITSVLTVTGTAPAESKILDYINNLYESGRFIDITTTSITRNDSNGIDFTLLSVLQPQAIGASSLDIAIGTLPRTITLTSVNSDEDLLIIEGTTPDGDEVVSYMGALEASKQFSAITLVSMSRLDDENMQFSLVLQGRN